MSEWAVTLVCGMLGVQTTILIAAIPWAYSMARSRDADRGISGNSRRSHRPRELARIASASHRSRTRKRLTVSPPFHQKPPEHCYLDVLLNAANMLKRGSTRQRGLNCLSQAENQRSAIRVRLAAGIT